MKRRLIAIFLALSATSALAWNAAGHRLVAAVAWRQMTPPAQRAAAALLRDHPDYPRWLAHGGGDPGYAAFVEASTWADDIRRDPRFADDAAPAEAGFADRARHKSWHYVDFDAAGHRRDGELDRQLERLIRELGAVSTPRTAKAYDLPWLIHLTGDIHQPLHAGSRDDEGGNRFGLTDPFNPRLPLTNLHAWWDDLPGPPWLRGARLEQAADALLAAHPAPPPQADVTVWREESRQIGRDLAYPAGGGEIDADFRARSQAITAERIAAAGYRLGRLLNALLARVPRETE